MNEEATPRPPAEDCSSASPDDERMIEFWSDEMMGIVERKAQRHANRWYLESDDLFQEYCLDLAAYAMKHGVAPIHLSRLYRICDYRTWNYRRIHIRMRGRLASDFEGEKSRAEPDLDAAIDVRNAISMLPPDVAEFIKGRYQEFFLVADLAKAKNISKTTVRSKCRLAWASMRSGLSAYGPTEMRDRSGRYKRNQYLLYGRNRGFGTNWSKWGPIPNQRDDD